MRFIGVEVERSLGGWSLAGLAWSFSTRTWSFPTTRLRVQPNYDFLRARINAAVGKVEPHTLSFRPSPPFDRRTRSATLFDAFSSSSLSLPSSSVPISLVGPAPTSPPIQKTSISPISIIMFFTRAAVFVAVAATFASAAPFPRDAARALVSSSRWLPYLRNTHDFAGECSRCLREAGCCC